jgi:NTE family protein
MTEEPVQGVPGEGGEPAPGIALCLSGGGYRAMLFHLGALWRLNEAGYLPRLERVSSVSGGSMTNGALANAWGRLDFDDAGVARNFGPALVDPVRQLAGKTIDIWAMVLGILLPGSIGNWYARSLKRNLLGRATLQDMPDRPRFIFNATNLQSAVLWRSSKPYMRDYMVGEIKTPTIELATAVAASGAFPPLLSPVTLKPKPTDWTPGSGLELQSPPYTEKVLLTDGGVYDNLGLETAWKRYQTILISDGGGHVGGNPDLKGDWIHQTIRFVGVIDSQVRALRKRQAIGGFQAGDREGTYWGIRTDIADYGLADALPCPADQTLELARTATRLKSMEPVRQERLINWGYAVCDAGMRRHVDPAIAPPAGFPYPGPGVG